MSMRKSSLIARLGALASAACVLISLNAASAQDDFAERLEALDGFLTTLEDLAMFNGAVLIDVGGEIVFERSYGFADYENEIPFTAETRFRIASVSKGMTEAALAVLSERGALSADSFLSEFVPDFPRADEITLEMLANHTSGVPHTNEQPWGDGLSVISLDEIIARLADLPLDFEPGTQSSYSNGGYALLARVIEIATGLSYGEAMEALVFAPLEMDDTGHIADSRAVIARLARGYEPGPVPGSRRHSRPYAVEMRPGGGSLYSSVHDMRDFMSAIYRDDFIAREHRDAFMPVGETMSGGGGRSPGFFHAYSYDHQRDILIVSFANNYSADFRWGNVLMSYLSDEPPLRTPPALAERFSDEALENFPGEYAYANEGYSQSMRIVRIGDGLALQDDESDFSAALLPLADGGFLNTMYSDRCVVDETEPGRFDCAPMSGGSWETDLVRRASAQAEN